MEKQELNYAFSEEQIDKLNEEYVQELIEEPVKEPLEEQVEELIEEPSEEPVIINKRKCGLKHNRNLEGAKRNMVQRVNNAMNNKNIVDNGKTMIIKIIMHITYQYKESPETTEDINEMIESLNRDYNNKSPNFNNYGKGLPENYGGGKDTYNHMISLADSANIHFVLDRVIYSKFILENNSPRDIVNYSEGDIDTMDRIVKANNSPSVSPDKFLNIWIVENLGGGLLGYATFPWDYSERTKIYDGVLINRSAFGKNAEMSEFNGNKTITHECGHWMGLFHVFQNTEYGVTETQKTEFIFDYKHRNLLTEGEMTGDCIEDTPVQKCATYGDPFSCHSLWKCTMDKGKKSWHMFMNFMDYVDDKAMFMFTKDQCTKLRLMLLMDRPGVVNYCN
jgi:hypothetical protein